MLELQGVSKSYDSMIALHPLNLSFPAGKTTVLLGPSGCGKSTILRILLGLISADTGQVVVDGTPLTAETVRSLRHRMGYVVQDGGLFPHLTARGNVAVLAQYLGWSRDRIEDRVAELVELTSFPRDGLDRYPSQLSGGQKQRVGLMRALMLDPEVLLLDEPLGALDPLIRADLQADLRRIFSQTLSKTVVLVTHDLGEAAFLGDDVVLLRDGQIVQRGAMSDLLERPADSFVTRFINAQRTVL